MAAGVDAKPSTAAASNQRLPSDFAAALVIIASLPLSDAEKAEAVRRLLAENPD
jgi:hypothetical protein